MFEFSYIKLKIKQNNIKIEQNKKFNMTDGCVY